MAAVVTSTVIVEAVTITGDAQVVSPSISFGGDADLTLTQSQATGGLFVISITNTFGNFFQFDFQGIAEQYALFEILPGAQITPQFVLATDPFVDNTGAFPQGTLSFALGQTRLFGYWDERSIFGSDPLLDNSVPSNEDNFGWVELTRTFGGLEATGGVTAIGLGIVAGTSTTIPLPEPSSLAFLGLFYSSVIFTRRRL